MKMVVVGAVLLGLVLVFTLGFTLNSGSNTLIKETTSGNGPSMKVEGSSSPPPSNKEIFVVTGENYKFVVGGESNPDIRVKVGDTVRIEFTSTGGFHDWVVDEFSAATKRVQPGADRTFVEFIADSVGTFDYYCSVGSHKKLGMVGNLIVEE